MLEAKLEQGIVLKKIIESMRDIVDIANFDCNPSGISMQYSDSAHIMLLQLNLPSSFFDVFRCDRSLTLGVNMGSLMKIIRCAGNTDAITLRAEDDGDAIGFIFESAKAERTCEYELRLMDISSVQLSVPEMEYDATIRMSAGEFQRICKDLLGLSETITISVIKNTVKFSASGSLGTGSVILHPGTAGSGEKTPRSAVDMDVDEEEEETQMNEDEERSQRKPSKESEEEPVTIIMNKAVSVTMSLKFLNSFTKATPLSGTVEINVTDQSPLRVKYNIGESGSIVYFLAPKMEDSEVAPN